MRHIQNSDIFNITLPSSLPGTFQWHGRSFALKFGAQTIEVQHSPAHPE
ncbi:hypothetical protein [Terriglobus albidus]|nr:hypothetical protein [Terriglobus albidus]